MILIGLMLRFTRAIIRPWFFC